MQQGYMNEFKELLKRNRYLTVCIPISFVGVILLVLFVGFLTNHVTLINEGLGTLKYEYVVIGREPNSINSFYRFDYLCSLSSQKKTTNLNVYMQVPGSKYRDNSPMNSIDLGTQDVAISKKTAKKMKLNIGDSVQLMFPVLDAPIEYTVADIFEYVDDYYDFNRNEDFSAVLLGYDEKLTRGMRNSVVSFLDEEEKNEFIASEASYIDIFDIRYDLKNLGIKSIIHDYSIGLIVSLVGLAFMLFEKKNVELEWRKFFFDGYTNRLVKKYHRLYGISVVIAPLVISAIAMCLLVGNAYAWCAIWSICYYLIWVRYSAYEKAV